MHNRILNILRRDFPTILKEYGDNDIFFYPEYFENIFIPELWGDPKFNDYSELVKDAKTIIKAGLSGIIILSQKQQRLYATSIEAHSRNYH